MFFQIFAYIVVNLLMPDCHIGRCVLVFCLEMCVPSNTGSCAHHGKNSKAFGTRLCFVHV